MNLFACKSIYPVVPIVSYTLYVNLSESRLWTNLIPTRSKKCFKRGLVTADELYLKLYVCHG